MVAHTTGTHLRVLVVTVRFFPRLSYLVVLRISRERAVCTCHSLTGSLLPTSPARWIDPVFPFLGH